MQLVRAVNGASPSAAAAAAAAQPAECTHAAHLTLVQLARAHAMAARIFMAAGAKTFLVPPFQFSNMKTR